MNLPLRAWAYAVPFAYPWALMFGTWLTYLLQFHAFSDQGIANDAWPFMFQGMVPVCATAVVSRWVELCANDFNKLHISTTAWSVAQAQV